ncbi:hypothetical protein BT96DRAFT_1002845 [Gymnopus androsaceus JB14]|uniref:Uncharacterized protein n=1 Tax=Gymnopus androsaceus JB14 TaxID=1447944 RepID=A0A6A4GXT0_9AGAR|nr:hypothetical protein BT96DRAFT_1002845 [Gymnopus androsaceus JB14]
MEAGEERENRKRLAEHDLAVVAKKRKRDTKRKEKQDADHQALLSLRPIYLTPSSFPKKFCKPDIILQINWHRTFSPSRVDVPKKSKCGEEGKTVAECIGEVEGEGSNEEEQGQEEIEDEDREDED